MDVQKLKSILQSAEQTSVTHARHCKQIKEFIESDKSNLAEVKKLMKCVFVNDYKDSCTNINRVIDFFALLFTSFKGSLNESENELMNHPTFVEIFDFLTKCSRCTHEFARYWSCKLLVKIFSIMEEVSDDIFEDLKEIMLDRLNDTTAIRFQAVLVLYRLQDPQNLDDPVTKKFHDLMSTDLNSKIRQLCLEKIAVRKNVFPGMLLRTRDIQICVRLSAFKRLSELFQYLNTTQKREFLRNGFNDLSEKVKEYFTNYALDKILEKYDSDYLKLLAAFRINTTDEDICETTFLVEKTLNIFFTTKPLPELIRCLKINDNRCINFEQLTWENIIYHRMLVQYLRKTPEFEAQLTAILPDLVDYCKYIREFHKFTQTNNTNFLQVQFMLKEMFLICSGYDIGDNASRESLKLLCYELLQSVKLNFDVSYIIVKNLENLIPNISDFCLFNVEIISNIAYNNRTDYEKLAREYKEKHLELSELRAEINNLTEEEQQFRNEQNYAEAQRVKSILNGLQEKLTNLQDNGKDDDNDPLEMQQDIPTILHYLTVTEAFLSSTKLTKMHPAVLTLKSSFIDICFSNENSEVQAKALKCYALCALIDQNIAKYGIHVFSHRLISYEEFDEVDVDSLLVSIKATIDLLLLYGPGIMAQPDDDMLSDSLQEEEQKIFFGGTSLSEVVNAFVALLDDKVPQVQEVACQALCNLIVFNRVESPSLISRLLLKWASPATDDKIKEFIGNTLNYIPVLSSFANIIEDVFIKTIQTKISAPRHSSLIDVNIDNLLKFMLVLCRMSPDKSKIFGKLTTRICNELNSDLDDKLIVAVYTKLLVQMEIEEIDTITKILELCNEVQDKLDDKKDLNNLNKFIKILNDKKSNLE